MSNQVQVSITVYISGEYSRSLLESVYNQVMRTIRCPTKYTCIRWTQSVTVHYYLLCQWIPIVTCNRHISYYPYYTYQSRS